jgi:hypothetical protein
MVELKVSEKDAQYLTEALLFASGCDVCAEWDKHDIESIFELAYKLKKQNPIPYWQCNRNYSAA